ncbi:unnamed protein product [Pylaiella littoralis]
MKSILSVQNAWNKSLIHDVLVRMSAASSLSTCTQSSNHEEHAHAKLPFLRGAVAEQCSQCRHEGEPSAGGPAEPSVVVCQHRGNDEPCPRPDDNKQHGRLNQRQMEQVALPRQAQWTDRRGAAKDYPAVALGRGWRPT